MTLQLNGENLTINAIKDFLYQSDDVKVTEDAYERVKQSRVTV